MSDAPDYTVDIVWLQRISDVVDYAITNDLYVIEWHHGQHVVICGTHINFMWLRFHKYGIR